MIKVNRTSLGILGNWKGASNFPCTIFQGRDKPPTPVFILYNSHKEMVAKENY